MVEVLDNACWHTSHHAVARNVFHHHGIGTDEHIVAHCDAANHFRTAAHLHVVAYYGSLQIMVKPYSDLLVYLAVFANSPITGAFRSWSNPIVTCWYILQFLPILSAEMIVEKPCCIIKPPPMSLVVISRVFFPLNHQLDSNLKTPTRL